MSKRYVPLRVPEKFYKVVDELQKEFELNYGIKISKTKILEMLANGIELKDVIRKKKKRERYEINFDFEL